MAGLRECAAPLLARQRMPHYALKFMLESRRESIRSLAYAHQMRGANKGYSLNMQARSLVCLDRIDNEIQRRIDAGRKLEVVDADA